MKVNIKEYYSIKDVEFEDNSIVLIYGNSSSNTDRIIDLLEYIYLNRTTDIEAIITYYFKEIINNNEVLDMILQKESNDKIEYNSLKKEFDIIKSNFQDLKNIELIATVEDVIYKYKKDKFHIFLANQDKIEFDCTCTCGFSMSTIDNDIKYTFPKTKKYNNSIVHKIEDFNNIIFMKSLNNQNNIIKYNKDLIKEMESILNIDYALEKDGFYNRKLNIKEDLNSVPRSMFVFKYLYNIVLNTKINHNDIIFLLYPNVYLDKYMEIKLTKLINFLSKELKVKFVISAMEGNFVNEINKLDNSNVFNANHNKLVKFNK